MTYTCRTTCTFTFTCICTCTVHYRLYLYLYLNMYLYLHLYLQDHLGSELEDYVKTLPLPVFVLRTGTRSGLIRAR